MKHLKKFQQCNEAKMFDDYKELIKHSETYLDEIYVQRPSNWKKSLTKIIEASGNTSFSNTANEIMLLSQEVQKDLNNLKNFHEDIKAHLKELDEIYMKSQQLSDADEAGYDTLESLESRVSNYIDFIEQYVEDLNQLAKNFENTQDLIRYLLKIDFKSFF